MTSPTPDPTPTPAPAPDATDPSTEAKGLLAAARWLIAKLPAKVRPFAFAGIAAIATIGMFAADTQVPGAPHALVPAVAGGVIGTLVHVAPKIISVIGDLL